MRNDDVWAVILHGGAGSIKADGDDRRRRGLLEALACAQAALERGQSAVDIAEAAVRALEDEPAFNAGLSSVLNSEGKREMDAAVMDGATLDVGAVCALQGFRHPVSIAKTLLREKTVLLASEGARLFALAHDAELLPDDALPPSADDGDTVGCIVLARGDMAVAASTGGLRGKLPGRVGDTPLAGCGFYAENGIGGVAFSGQGEAVIRTALGARAMGELARMMPQKAMDHAIARISQLGAPVGGIALAAGGEIGWAHNCPHFSVGILTPRHGARAFLKRSEMTESL
jgi:beta-aspartyl-peptidase (threonine type)